MEKRTIYLKCNFTEEERNTMARQVTELISKKAEAEGKLKSVSTQIKSEIAGIDAEMAKVSEMVRSGYEYRNVDCEVRSDYVAARVVIIRLDSGEIVEDRPMRMEETQRELFRGEDRA
jgi:hypothetical protein